MGIRGLKTFIDNNSDLKTRHQLHDTCLVVDGSNLIFSLYWRSSQVSNDHIYGGDYCRYATTVHHFFKTLQKCGIEVLVVFDGGIDPNQQKIKKINERFRQKLEEANRISKGFPPQDKVIPGLCKQVFLDMLDEVDVHHIQAPFEADSLIAKIANQLKCPVLSNDSDFFVFDLQFGVISIDSLLSSLQVKTYLDPKYETISYKYLDCDLFLIENLIQYFPGLKREVLPLFSTLMGNDWVDCHVFDTIFNAIPNVWTNSRKKSKALHVGKRHLQMLKLLSWLRGKTTQQSIDFLINFLRKNSRDRALNLLRVSLENYSNGVCCEQSFEQNIDLCDLSSLVPNKDFDEWLPVWFVEEFRRSQISANFMDILNHKTLYLSPRIEDLSLSSSYTSGLEIRQFIFALLRLDDKDINTITIIDRKGTQMHSYPLEPKPLTPNEFHILPNIYQIRKISIDERRELLADILFVDNEIIDKIKTTLLFDQLMSDHKSSDTDGGVFLVIAIKYWIRKIDHKIWFEFIYSLIICIMFYGFVGSYNKYKFISFDKKQIKQSIDMLSKFNCRPQHNCAKVFQSRIVHFFNEFQDCFRNIRSLNLLFDKPFPMGKPFFCLNGPFIYNLTVELSSRKDPVLYLSQMFERKSSTTTIFKQLLDVVFDGLDPNKFVRCLEVMNRRTHIQNQKIRPNKKKLNNNKNSLQNRFSALKVTDNK